MNWSETWQSQPRHVIAPYVGSEGMEAGTSAMAGLAASHPEVHEQFVSNIERGLRELDADEAEVLRVLDSAGFRLQRKQEALEFLQRLLALYLAKYREQSAAFQERGGEA